MTVKVLAVVTCERCRAVAQSTMSSNKPWTADNVDPPEAWSREIPVDDKAFMIEEVRFGSQLDDYPGERDDRVPIWLDLCPGCKLAFATWWLEGRRA